MVEQIKELLDMASKALENGAFQETERVCRRIMTLAPDEPEAAHLAGLALWYQGKLKRAASFVQRAIDTAPDRPNYHYNLANILSDSGKSEEALASYDQALALRPDYFQALVNKGNALNGLQRFADAAECLRQAVTIKPDAPEAHNNLGNSLMELNQLDAAKTEFEHAVAVDPSFFPAWTNLGSVQKKLGAFADAETSLKKAIELAPDSVEAHFSLADVLLVNGHFTEGWREYEWRLQKPVLSWLNLPQLRWNGVPCPDQSVAVLAEQGLGDTIQFIRYLPMIKKRCGRLIFSCQKLLLPLLEGMDIDELLDASQVKPDEIQCDYQIPLLSLPGLMGAEFESIPSEIPYLSAPQSAIETWGETLSKETSADARKIGLCWAGSATNANDRNRSMPFSTLRPLIESAPGHFISLQKGRDEEAARNHAEENANFSEFSDDIHSFADTAGLIANLDLVISVDTAVAHLAGAMGKPVWLLIPYDGEWRWLRDRNDSPWYPTMRIFRQTEPGNWSELVEHVKSELSS